MAVYTEIILCTKKCWCGGCKGQINFGVKFLKIITTGSWRRRVNLCPDCVVSFAEQVNQDSLYRDKKEVRENG